GADWKVCCRRLQVERGIFFHNVYRIQQILGRTFAELKPYALYPLDEYFCLPVTKDSVTELIKSNQKPAEKTGRKWNPPLPRSAKGGPVACLKPRYPGHTSSARRDA